MTEVCYLLVGVGRSGTSALAGTFYRAHYKGEPVQMLDLIPADRGNPKGFFEDERVVRLNDTILGEAGTWVLSELETDFSHLMTETKYDQQVKDILDRYDSPAICIKDPRLSLTLPVYVRELEARGIKCHIVHVRRRLNRILDSFLVRDLLTNDRATKLVEKYRGTLAKWCKRLQYGRWSEVSFDVFMHDPLSVFKQKFPELTFKESAGWAASQQVLKFLGRE